MAAASTHVIDLAHTASHAALFTYLFCAGDVSEGSGDSVSYAVSALRFAVKGDEFLYADVLPHCKQLRVDTTSFYLSRFALE